MSRSKGYKKVSSDFPLQLSLTPVSKTGSTTGEQAEKLAVTSFSPYNGTAAVVPCVDWLQGCVEFSGHALLHDFIFQVSSKFSCQFTSDLGGVYCGRYYDHHIRADGLILRWKDNFDFDSGELVSISVSLSCSSRGIRIAKSSCISDSSSLMLSIFKYLLSIKFKFTRVDLAIDDYAKKFHYQVLKDSFLAGEIRCARDVSERVNTRFIKGQVIDNGWTFYIGSRSGDKMFRYYDKNVESKGIVDSYRLELELHDSFSHSAIEKLCSVPCSQFYNAVAGIVLGLLKAKDGSHQNDDCCLLWFHYFSTLYFPLGVVSGRVVPSLEQSFVWLRSQVARTLAMANLVHSDLKEFSAYLSALLAYGHERLTRVHRAKILQYEALANLPNLTYAEIKSGIF